MGMLRFLVCPANRLTPSAVESVYVTGSEQIPWRCRNRYQDGLLTIDRGTSDSGSVHVPWHIPGTGELILSTATLLERESPYLLAVELARGKLHQVRNQLAEWRSIGLTVPEGLEAKLQEALHLFARAVVIQSDPEAASELAEQSLQLSLEVAELLVERYTRQALAARRRQSGAIGTLLGIDLGHRPLDRNVAATVASTFNAVSVPLNWCKVEATEGTYSWDVYDAQVKWARARGLTVCGGPLLRLDEPGMPDWLYLWEGDADNIMSFASDWLETVVHRYRGQFDYWIAAARFNVEPTLKLDDEQRVKLVVRSIDIVRNVDPDVPILVRFDRPWAEYMRRRDMTLPPLHFADMLVRSNLGLAGLDLEVNFGFEGGTPLRDMLDISRLVDLWSRLGVPLFVTVSFPSDSATGGSAELVSTARPQKERSPAVSSQQTWNLRTQKAWAKRIVALLMAKPAVRGVFWNQLTDAPPQALPAAGLFDGTGKPKPVLRRLQRLREKFMG